MKLYKMVEEMVKEKVYEQEYFTKKHFDAFCVTCGSFDETRRFHFSDGFIEKIPVVRFFEWHKHQGKFREYLVIPEPSTRKKRYQTQRFYLETYDFAEIYPQLATIYDLNGLLIAQRRHPYQPFYWVCRRTFYQTDTQEYLTEYQLRRRRKRNGQKSSVS